MANLTPISPGSAASAAGGGGSASTGLVTCTVSTGDPAQPLDPGIPVLSISIHKEVNKIPSARLVILDGDPAAADFPISDMATLVPGTPIQIDLGYDSTNTTVFTGLIVTHGIRVASKDSYLQLDCRDEAVKMTMVPQNKHYNNITDSDLANQLIGNYSKLTPDVTDTSVNNENLVQCNLTDWDFLVSRIDRLGMITTVDQGTITTAAPDPSASPVITLTYGTDILEFQAQMDARTQVASVQVSSWDAPSQSVISTPTQYQASNEEGNITADDLSGALGVALLDLRSPAALAPDERQAIADARQMKNVLSKIRGKVKFRGFSGVNPGDMLTLAGLGDRFNGAAFVSAVRHEYAEGDWTTEASLGLPLEWFADKAGGKALPGANATPVGSASSNLATGLYSTLHGLQVGIVSDIVDPDNEFKVQVKMPAVNADDAGIWARVATLDAGDSRGTFFRPEISDEVILGFINGDPSQPVILGMMHSSALPAPITPASDNDQKGLTTRSGMSVMFDDGQNSIVISTPSGRQITLNDQSGDLQITDGSNTISFDSSGVTINSGGDLTLQASGNVSISGNQLSLDAQTSLDVSGVNVSISGSAETAVSGALVKIN